MTHKGSNVRFPAEFEEQEAVWLGWPVYEVKQGLSSVPVFIELIRVLVSHIKVNMAAQNAEEKRTIENTLTSNGISIENITIYCIPHNDIWFRDMGPIFLVDNNNKLIVQEFQFNGWGYEAPDSPVIYLDQHVPQMVATECGYELRSSTLVSEGGDRTFNGKGTMISVEAVELQRNPDKTRDEIEEEFKKIFNLKNVIWLKRGIYDDDKAFSGLLLGPDGLNDIMTAIATGGHIDEHCRFVSEDTVLVAQVTEEEVEKDPIAKVNYERLEENVAILKKSVIQDGRSLNIVRIPMPIPLYSTMKKGDGVYDYYDKKYFDGFVYPIRSEIDVIAATSYNNFLITNGAVLAPKYWKPGLPASMKQKDSEAQEILASLFPDRKVYTFDVKTLNFGGGGIHCITQQQPVC